MAIYLFSNHLVLYRLQVACSLKLVGVRTYVPCSYVVKL